MVINGFDENGNLIEESKYSTHYFPRKYGMLKLFMKNSYLHYAYKNILSEKEYYYDLINKSWKAIRRVYSYSYDYYNNWVQRIEFIDEQPSFWIERKIEYY